MPGGKQRPLYLAHLDLPTLMFPEVRQRQLCQSLGLTCSFMLDTRTLDILKFLQQPSSMTFPWTVTLWTRLVLRLLDLIAAAQI